MNGARGLWNWRTGHLCNGLHGLLRYTPEARVRWGGSCFFERRRCRYWIRIWRRFQDNWRVLEKLVLRQDKKTRNCGVVTNLWWCIVVTFWKQRPVWTKILYGCETITRQMIGDYGRHSETIVQRGSNGNGNEESHRKLNGVSGDRKKLKWEGRNQQGKEGCTWGGTNAIRLAFVQGRISTRRY